MQAREAKEWACAPADLSALERLTLLLLATSSDAGTVTIKRAEIAALAGVKPLAVSRALAELTARGLIQATSSTPKGATYALVGMAWTTEPVTVDAPLEIDGWHANAPIQIGVTPRADIIPQDKGSPVLELPQNASGVYPYPPGQGSASRVDNTSFLPSLSSFLKEPPNPQKLIVTANDRVSADFQQPQPIRDPDAQLDLLGLPANQLPTELFEQAVRYWQHWQAKIRTPKPVRLTEQRRDRFLKVWRLHLGGSMTNWLRVCRACVENHWLANGSPSWAGADFDWALRTKSIEKILAGNFPSDWRPAEQPGAA